MKGVVAVLGVKKYPIWHDKHNDAASEVHVRHPWVVVSSEQDKHELELDTKWKPNEQLVQSSCEVHLVQFSEHF